MEETGPINTDIAAEAEGGVMNETADADQVSIKDDAPEMQQQTAKESLTAEVEAEAPSDRGSIQVEQQEEELPTATAEAGEIPSEDPDMSTEAVSEEPANPPPAATEDTQPQASSEETSEQPVVEDPSLATLEPEAAAAAAAPVELSDPAVDPELKPASLSSQSEESIRAYLDNTVVPVLRDGLRMLVKERPDDPCNYLVDYIKAHHP